MKKYKKNYAKYLPKIGSTAVVALAMSVALAAPANASELSEGDTPPMENPPADTDLTSTPTNAGELVETNGAIAQENQDTLDDNEDILDSNETTLDANENAADTNEENSKGALENPDLEAPVAPNTPDTEGLDADGYNNVIDDYNNAVDDYNDAVDGYNSQVGDYNADAQQQDKLAEENHRKELEQYEKDVIDHQEKVAAREKYEKELAEYEANKERLEAEYQQKLTEYNAAKTQYELDVAAREKYEKELAEYEANKERLEAEYQQKLTEYNAAKTQHELDVAAREKYEKELAEYEANKERLEAEYQQKLTEYNAAKTQHELDVAAREKYEKELAEYEANKERLEAEYQQKLADYNAAKEAHKQQDTEHDIFVEVDGYNQDITDKNNTYTEWNETMLDNVDVGVAKELEDVGELNENVVNTVVDADTLAVLGTYDALMDRLSNEETGLLAQAEALSNHPGKDQPLGSAEYAEYLAAVEAYNAAVEDFNADVDIYNLAVEAYNKAVDDYNANKPEDSTTTTGQTQSTGTADWGNFSNKNLSFNHIDVRYHAAEVKNADGEPNSKYDVVGVYYDEAEQDKVSTKYGVTYTNTRGSTVYYDMVKDNDHDEFGTASTDRYGNIDRTDANANKNTVVTFYATLKEGDELKEIFVELDANSVYANNSYVKYDRGDHLGEFRDSNGKALNLVEIDGELYYDVSGQSVFLVSALVCDGYAYRLGGLDLVLNIQTMIEIHQSDSAKKLSYLGYQLGRTAHAIDPGDPGEFNEAEPEAPKAPDFVPEADTFDEPEPEAPKGPDFVPEAGTFDEPEPEAPKAPDFVPEAGTFDEPEPEAPKAPDFVPEAGTFDKQKPNEPTPSTLLNTLNTLQKLEYKFIIDFPEPEPMDPTPDPAPVPLVVDGDGLVEIEEEDVPLADAPQTGDISGFFAALSSLSLGGLFLLNHKGKDEE